MDTGKPDWTDQQLREMVEARIPRREKNRREAHKARMERIHRHARAIVATGKCPDCGAPLYRNNALAGWWQCEGYPSPGFRHPGFENLPKSNFQTFTE